MSMSRSREAFKAVCVQRQKQGSKLRRQEIKPLSRANWQALRYPSPGGLSL